jgi:hypothetical protein
MNIATLSLGIILGGIATLVTLIFMIISFAGGKSKNGLIWLGGFVVAICILIMSIFFMVRRIGEKVKEGVDWTQQQSNSYTTEADLDYKKTDRQNFLDTLTFYTREASKARLPSDYYTNKKADKLNDTEILVPFVYPLSIHYNTGNYLGAIASSENDSIYLTNVSQMAFDENFVIARVNNSDDKELLKSGRGEIEYVLFDMRTREFLSFVNLEQLLDKSEKIGYVGPQQMNYLSDDYTGWVEFEEAYD